MNLGSVKLMRSEETAELIRRPKEWALLSQIALRARRKTSSSTADLGPGEALIGDFRSCGLTEQEYRIAKRNLEKWGFITTRSTNRGTIAKLMNSTVFDINIEGSNDQTNDQATVDQRAVNGQATTNKNLKKDKKGKKERKHLEHSPDARAFNAAEKSLRMLGEIAGAEVMQTFRREVVSRIGEVAPQAAQRILGRLSGRGLFGEAGRG